MKALITGITGQDGAYLANLLLKKDYEVHGLVRRSSSINTSRIDDLISEYTPKNRLQLHYSDLLDSSSITNLINSINPDEIYNLAAQSHVSVSFENPIYTTQVGTLGSITILEALKHSDKKIKFYQASSSEMFGGSSKEILDEADKVDYHGLALELNQELINNDSFSLYGGMHYKHLWSISFSTLNTAFAILTGEPKYLANFNTSVGPGFQVGAKFKTEPNGEFWALQYYKSDEWSGLKIQYGFVDFDQFRR